MANQYILFNFLLFLYIPFLMHGNIENHLRKAENKFGNHNMRNIDFIYMINLDHRPEKWHLANSQLAPYGIFPYRFPAIYGMELPLETINDVGVKFESTMTGGFLGTTYAEGTRSYDIIKNIGQTYFCYDMERGPIAIVLSHLSVLRDALDSGYETIWVMEDDIEVISDPRQISELIEKLDRLVGKENWDVLFTDRNTKGSNGEEVPAAGIVRRPNFRPLSLKQYYIKQQVSPDFIQIGARFGAYSMILRRSGIKKIYDFITSHSLFLPYDMDYYAPPGIKIYTVSKNIVSTIPGAPSDNRDKKTF